MRAVVQRVIRASVEVGEERVGGIDRGLLALIGVASGDSPTDVERMAEKLVHLRVFEDDAGRMNRSLLDTGFALAIVSQFTLLGDCRKGRRPSFQAAAAPDVARVHVDALVDCVAQKGVPVATGRFREQMRVELVNDGPVTLLLDTCGDF